jgi:hypothetical protein
MLRSGDTLCLTFELFAAVNVRTVILCVTMPCNQAGAVAVMLCASVCEGLGLNLGQDTSSPDFFLLFLSPSMQALEQWRKLT